MNKLVIKRNTAPEFHTNLQILLQQDSDAFAGTPEAAKERIDNYFESPSFVNFSTDPQALTRVKEAGAIVGPDAGINLLKEGQANRRKQVYDFVGNVHTAATRDLLIGVDAVDLKSKDTPERFKGMETDQTAVKQDMAKIVDDFQLTNPLTLNSFQIAQATNWVPSITYNQAVAALIQKNPSFANEPIALQTAAFQMTRDNIRATEMKYGTGAVDRLRAEGKIVSDDNIAMFRNIEQAYVSAAVDRRIDAISKDFDHPQNIIVNTFLNKSRNNLIDLNKKEDLLLVENYKAVEAKIIEEEDTLFRSTGYFDTKGMFMSSVMGDQDTRMHVLDTDTNITYSLNPNITPEGTLKLYDVNDPSRVEFFEVGDIFEVDGKEPAQAGVLSEDKLEHMRKMIVQAYETKNTGRNFYVDLFNQGFDIAKPIDVQIEEAEEDAQRQTLLKEIEDERFSRPLTNSERKTFARTGKLPEGVKDLTGPRPLAVEADKFEKDGKSYQLTRKQRRDYQSTGKLPEGVTKVE